MRIGCDRKGYFFRTHEQEKLFALCPDATFIECSGLVEEGRLIKSDYEIELMRKAARAAEAVMKAGIAIVATGVSENDVAADIHYAMYKAGGEYPALSPFVASGPRCLIGHATWEGRIIQPGDCVMLETNMTFHLIPWIQIPELGVMALSETIRVTEDGCESLLNFERKLFIQHEKD